MKIYKCKKCSKEICIITVKSGSGLCQSCANIIRFKDPKEHEKSSKANIKRYKDPKEREKTKTAMNRPAVKEKLRQANLGKPSNFKGKTHKKESREKIREANNIRWSDPKERERMSKALKGKKQTQETIEKRRKKLIGKIKTKEQRRNCSLAKGGTGIPYENSKYSSDFSNDLKKEIHERDNFKCQCCGMTQEQHFDKYNRNIEIHHIDHDKFNCKPENLITTCKICNLKANSDIDYWFAFYTYKIENNILLTV